MTNKTKVGYKMNDDYNKLQEMLSPTVKDWKQHQSSIVDRTGCEMNFQLLVSPLVLRYCHHPIVRVNLVKNHWCSTVGTFKTLEEVVNTHINYHPSCLDSIYAFPEAEYCFVNCQVRQIKRIADYDRLPYEGVEKLLIAHRAVIITH